MPHAEQAKGAKRPKSSKTHHKHKPPQAPISSQWAEPRYIDEYKRGFITSRKIPVDEYQRFTYDEWNWAQWDRDVESYIHFTWCGLDGDWRPSQPRPKEYPAYQEGAAFAGNNIPQHTYVSENSTTPASAGAYGRAAADAPSTAADAIADRLRSMRFAEEPIIVAVDDDEGRCPTSSDGHKSHGSGHSHRSHKSRDSHRSGHSGGSHHTSHAKKHRRG